MLTSIKVFTGNTITEGQPIGITLNKVQGVLEKGVKYSLQFKVINYSSINTLNYIYVGTQKISNIDISQGTVIDTVDGNEVRLCSVEFTASSKVTNPVIKIGRNMESSDTSNTLMYELTDFQLERGYKTNYSPNSNDLQIVKTDLESKINQLADSLQFYVAKNDFDNLGNTVSSALGQIEVSTGEISLKVEQTDIDNAKNELEGSIDKKISNAKAEIKMTTDSISQRVSSTESTTSTLTNKVTVVESTANTANSKVDNLQVGGTNLWVLSDLQAGYESSGDITSSTACHQTRKTIIDISDCKTIVYQVWNPNKVANTSNTNRIAFFDNEKTWINSITLPQLNGDTYQTTTITKPTNAVYAKLGAITGASSQDADIKIKFEKGNKPTDYTPAPEDVQGNIDTAQTTANSANTLANTANNTANTNKTNITTLQSTVTTTNNKVAELTTSLDSITQRVSSNETTTSTLTTTVESVKTTANNANTNASNALDKANTASTNASNAVTTANKANTTASTASTNATTALNMANSAKDTASSASTKADGAVSTANTAKSTADKAQTTANSANTLANTANNTANTNKNNITTLQTTVTTTNNKVAELTTSLDGITQRVASTESTTANINATLNKVSGGLNKWLFEVFDRGSVTGTGAITLNHLLGKVPRQTLLVSEPLSSSDLLGADTFLGRLTTNVYLDADYTWNATAYSDDGSSIYLNGNLIVSMGTCVATSITMPFKKGWNKITWVFNENAGSDVAYFTPAISSLSQIKIIDAFSHTNIDEDKSILNSNITNTNNRVAEITTNLDGITQRVSSTESTVSSHTTQLGTVDTRINNAKNSAISTASSDATTKANNALASAKTDATTKANNALADAKTYTNGQITTVNTTINNKVAEIKATTDAITQRVSSTESSTTTLTTKLNNLQIGGKNLYKNSTRVQVLNGKGAISKNVSGAENGFKISPTDGGSHIRVNNVIQSTGDYTVSFLVKADKACSLGVDICDYQKIFSVTTSYTKIEYTANTQRYNDTYHFVDLEEYTGATLFVKDFKVEKGNKATDWSPAPEDVQSQIDTAQSTANTANSQATTNKNNISTLTTTVSNTNNKVSSLETNLSAITQRVSATETTTTTLNSKVNTAQSTADSATTKANNAQNTANTANSTANSNKTNISNLTTRVSTAESKLTKDSLTTTIGSHYTTSSDVNGIVTSKGYATTSQVQQTKNELTATFKSSGGYNLIKNGCAKLDTSHWSNNGGGIGRSTNATGGVVDTFFTTTFPNGITTDSIELKNNTDYVYQAMLYLPNNTLQGHGASPLHFWCNTSPSSAGNPQLTILDYSQNIPTANTWAKCYVHFRTASSGKVYFKPFIYTSGASMTVYVSEIMLCESSVSLPYSPHPSEIYDGITKIDKDGITVTQSNAKTKTTMSADGFAITRTDKNADIFRVGSNGLLTLNGVFKCYKDNANMSGARLESSGAIMFGYNNSTSTKPVFASGLWTDENMGYFSVGYTRADVTDENGCLWMSPQQGNNGCRLTYSKLVGGNMASTNLYFQKDGALLFSSNINGLNSTDDRYTYQFDSGVSTRALRCDNLRTYHIYPRNTGSSNIGSPSMRYRDIFADSLSTTNNQLRLGTVKSDGSWQTYGALDINSSTGYIFPHKGNGQLSLGTNGSRFHGIYLVNSPNVSSDKRLKTDIHYLDEPMPEEPTILDGRVERNMKITTKDMYDFIKDDLKLASYRYNLNLERGNTATDYGFIAQDILYTKVGSELIQLEDKEDLNSTLSYNQGNYISTIVGALQEAINKIEVLEKKVQELESKLV